MTCRIQKEISQLSSHKSSVNLSPLLGNTLGETWTNLRESRSEKKNYQRLRNTADKEKKQIKWTILSALQAVIMWQQATNKLLLRQQRKHTESITVEGWNWLICDLSCCTEHRRHCMSGIIQLHLILRFFPEFQCGGNYWFDEPLITIYVFQTPTCTFITSQWPLKFIK